MSRCNELCFISVMADETTDCSGVEQLSICCQYVSEVSKGKFEVCEDFLCFVDLQAANAESVTNAILSNIRKWGVNPLKVQGKGFDSASIVSGHISGVQARITRELPLVKHFTHCSSHCLNLVVVQCSKVKTICYFMDSFQKITVFIRGTAK